jgi:hypothetical protein
MADASGSGVSNKSSRSPPERAGATTSTTLRQRGESTLRVFTPSSLKGFAVITISVSPSVALRSTWMVAYSNSPTFLQPAWLEGGANAEAARIAACAAVDLRRCGIMSFLLVISIGPAFGRGQLVKMV